MAIQMPKLALPKLERKTILMAVGGVVAVAAAGWFAWDTFMSEPPPPPPPRPVAKAMPTPAPTPAQVTPAAGPATATAPVAAAAPASAPTMANEPKPAEPVAAAPAPKPAAAPRRHSRANEDARVCLQQDGNGLIARCAEKYR